MNRQSPVEVRDYTQIALFTNRLVESIYTDPYEELSGVFHVLRLFLVKEFISLNKLRR